MSLHSCIFSRLNAIQPFWYFGVARWRTMPCSSRISFAIFMGVSLSVGIILQNEEITACLILGSTMCAESESTMQVLLFGTPGITGRKRFIITLDPCSFVQAVLLLAITCLDFTLPRFLLFPFFFLGGLRHLPLLFVKGMLAGGWLEDCEAELWLSTPSTTSLSDSQLLLPSLSLSPLELLLALIRSYHNALSSAALNRRA